MNVVTLTKLDAVMGKQPVSVARRVLETYGEAAEAELLLRIPDVPARNALIRLVGRIRKDDEIKAWNRSN